MSDKPSSFEALCAELEEMRKALPTDGGGDDDATIEEAAEDGSKGGKQKKDEAGLDLDGDADAANGKGGDMTKSFKIKLESGEEVDAFDGSAMIKALGDRLDASAADLGARVSASEEVMAKALGQTVELLKAQGTLLKSLSDQVSLLSGQGRGRKAVVTISERPSPTAETMAKAEPGTMPANEFLLKADVAFKAGKITGLDVSRVEAHLNRGQPVPSDIVARVLA